MTDIESQWAWTRIEAMADQSLGPDEQRRMRDAMAAEPELDRAVRSATALRRELRRLARVPAPTALRRRLLGIPSDGPSHAALIRFTTWAAGLAVATAVAVAFLWLHTGPANGPSQEVARAKAEAQAVEDFVIAMTYLQKSATIANTETTAAVGGSLHDALSASRDTDREQKRQLRKNGG